MTPAEQLPARSRRARGWGSRLASVVASAFVVIGGVLVWSAPRDDVPLPGPDAGAEQVVLAYLDAVNARDFDTANAIDAREHTDIGRFDRPMAAHDVRINHHDRGDNALRAHVTFLADFSGGDGTVEDGWWGYVLGRDEDGRWVIVDAGVA